MMNEEEEDKGDFVGGWIYSMVEVWAWGGGGVIL